MLKPAFYKQNIWKANQTLAQELSGAVSTAVHTLILLHCLSLLLSAQDTLANVAGFVEIGLLLFICLSYEVVLYLLRNFHTLGNNGPRYRKLLRSLLDLVGKNNLLQGILGSNHQNTRY
jgi:hypothetical protein